MKTPLLSVIFFNIAIALIIGASWIVNLVKLIKCDFEAPYKGEIVHAIGLIPVASVVTVWFSDEPAAINIQESN